MPTTSSASPAARQVPDDILDRLSSIDATEKLQALREVKNQIIGNRTKKLSFLKVGAVPAVVSALASALEDGSDLSLIVQSAAAVGSFACGFDAGVKAVLDAGAFPVLERLLAHPDAKVVDAGARSLKMIYQSKVAPKYELSSGKQMESLLSLLNNVSENLNGLGLSIIAHSCRTSVDQKTLCEAGILKKVIDLLDSSISLKDACLESLSTLTKANSEVIARLGTPECGTALSSIIELTHDKSPRTRLLACSFLTNLRNSDPTHLQDASLKTKLVHTLLELVDDAGQVGDDALFVLSDLFVKEDMQRLAYEVNAIERLCSHFSEDTLSAKRLNGILLALAELCSVLESCRSRLLSSKALNSVTDALTHDIPELRAAACICLKNLSRSVQFVSAGHLMTEKTVKSLVDLLQDMSHSVQVASLGTVGNIVVDFASRKSVFRDRGGVHELIQLSQSMDTEVKVSAVMALRNLMFQADKKCKEKVFSDLTVPLIESLINDCEPLVQEQALAMVRNLVDGPMSNIDFVFAEDSVILNAVSKQLQNAGVVEVQIQGMCVMSNAASGNETHKDAVMHKVAPEAIGYTIKFLQSTDSRLRTATIWTIVNLTHPSSPGAHRRVERLHDAGIISQIKTMVNDESCLDVKLRAMTVIQNLSAVGDVSVSVTAGGCCCTNLQGVTWCFNIPDHNS
ncbi:unnamed protein product [Rhodiola kirilowii]